MTAPSLNCPTSEPADRPRPDRGQDGRAPRRRRRGDRALTTLEWLLIVAAVAGIAALAVVLVQNVVSDTSEQIAGSSARQVAARLAADQVVVDSKRTRAEQPTNSKSWGQWQRFYESRCKRLEITYGDTGMKFAAAFTKPTGKAETADFDPSEIGTGATATCTASAS